MQIGLLLPLSFDTHRSAVAVITGKYRPKVNMEREIGLPLSTMQPRFQKLYSVYRNVGRDPLGVANNLQKRLNFFKIFPLRRIRGRTVEYYQA